MIDDDSNAWALVLGIDPRTLPPMPKPGPIIVEDINENKCSLALELAAGEFRELMPFLPPEPRSAAAITNLQVLNALLWSQLTGRALTNLPGSYGSSEAVRKRAQRWSLAKVGEAILDAIDGLTLRPNMKVAVRKCAAGLAQRGERIKRSRTRVR